MKLSQKENRALAKLAKALRTRFKAEKIILYGSAVRDELDEGSDIDIMIVLPEVNWNIEKDIIQMCFDTELECERVFSVVCYSTDELEHNPLRSSPLVLNVHKEGQSI